MSALPNRDRRAERREATRREVLDAAGEIAREVGLVAVTLGRWPQLLWATVDSPWVQTVDPAKFAASLRPLRDFGPSAVLSTHLPPVTDDSTALFATLLDVPSASPFTGPDQAALEAMLRQFEPA